jgi:hypothetical protein
MLQSDILNVVYNRITAANILPGRVFTSSNVPLEQQVSQPRIVLSLLPATAEITTLGSDDVCRRREYGGVVFAAVHTPIQKGEDITGIRYAEQIQALFEGRNADAPLYYDNVAVRTTGRDGTAAYVTNCVITYRLETVR